MAGAAPSLEQHDFVGKYCPGCGKRLHESAMTCPQCGATQPGFPRRNRIAAAILALVLGGFGVHKFYLGQIGWGLMYLVFCWTLIPWLIAFIEFIILLFQSDAEFAAKYG
ncbi:hypothetical protein DLJ53_17015 [Acuticoccus sediminis]|uniref:TM2 domain-containing protein n=1 Tax=Acuticoccus sediminis TaxID=2184697 RepID=A0A8B2NYQ1_9HYPH|nr:TM2 domain-containing protein [Acuticoccus sediminis]RAI00928.1 hypothetical protein DLJ53_17015 [Acuticoccus sediminis]